MRVSNKGCFFISVGWQHMQRTSAERRGCRDRNNMYICIDDDGLCMEFEKMKDPNA